MDWLDKHFSIFPAPESVLVIGAGQGGDLPVLSRDPGTRLLLVEPQPQWAETLREKVRELPTAQVHECALDSDRGLAALKIYNFPELSSLRPDRELAALLPGARQTAELMVQTRPLSELAEALGVSGGPNHWLVVDAPGLETVVLEALDQPGLLERFGHLVLRTGRSGNRRSESSLEELKERFLELGYQPLGLEDQGDGDWPRLHFQHFGDAFPRKELEEKMDAMEQRSVELARQNAELQRQLDEQRAESDSRGARIEAQRQEQDARLEGLQKEIAELQQEVDQAHSDLAVSLRLQTLRENDLRELQERYGQVLETREAQHELLLKLRKRLGLAAEFLQQIEHEHDDARKDELTSGLVRALAHDFVEGD